MNASCDDRMMYMFAAGHATAMKQRDQYVKKPIPAP